MRTYGATLKYAGIMSALMRCCVAASISALFGGTVGVPAAAAPSPLKVSGTHVVNANNERVWLRGVNAACMEWTSDGEGHILDTVNTAIRD